MTHPDLHAHAGLPDEAARTPEALLRAAHPRLYAIAYAWLHDRDQAEDLVQEAMLRIYVQLKAGQQVGDFGPWSGTITRNLAANWRRSGQRRSKLLQRLEEEVVVTSRPTRRQENPRETLERQQQHAEVEKRLAHLPTDLREVVLLHYAEELSRSEIARL